MVTSVETLIEIESGLISTTAGVATNTVVKTGLY